MGFDAIWISPVSRKPHFVSVPGRVMSHMLILPLENTDRDTPYHYAYHGYWINDPRALNPRFGTADDLKALSKALHDRGMYLMVDIVVNNIPGTTVNDSFSTSDLVADGSIWTDPSEFHPQCWIDYSNQTSVENCWLGDDKLPLMDVNTENKAVISTLQAWISNLTAEYMIDGLRIDAAKHVPGEFWTGFCGAAGVFCIGEVFTDDIGWV